MPTVFLLANEEDLLSIGYNQLYKGPMRVAGEYINVGLFRTSEEGYIWLEDVGKFLRLTAYVNRQYADTPQHRERFISVILPAFDSFVQQWGIARVPHDIRASILDGYDYFDLQGAPSFPPTIRAEWN